MRPQVLAVEPRASAPPSRPQELRPGEEVVLSGQAFAVTELLGRGSFGEVWGARGADGARIAIKEIMCRCEADLAKVVEEGEVLKSVAGRLKNSGMPQIFDHVPALIASDVEAAPAGRWRVRLVMSEVPGRPLEEYLRLRRQEQRRGALATAQEQQRSVIAACRLTGLLIAQLAPVLEAISPAILHRDVTPRNIQVADADGDHPRFGLVDFGLAVDADAWQGSNESGGDGRYWPASAWFAFSHGSSQLQTHAAMNHEYRKCLDLHSLGISAVRCFLDLVPNLESAEAPSADPRLSEVIAALQELRAAWAAYWADAQRFWQPLFDAFRAGGGFEALREVYVCAGVHRIVATRVRALRLSLRRGRVACECLLGVPALFDALLVMLQAAEEGAARTAPAAPTADCAAVRCSSASTGSPSSASSASGVDIEPRVIVAPAVLRRFAVPLRAAQ